MGLVARTPYKPLYSLVSHKGSSVSLSIYQCFGENKHFASSKMSRHSRIC